jgi:hypothetical protein
MSLKRTKLLEEVYRKVATPAELRKLDELYEKRAKGVATAMMTRRLVELLTFYISKYGVPNKTPSSRVETPTEQPNFNRVIKINGNGKSESVWW